MAELIVSIEDTSKISDIKRAIRMIRGVAGVRATKQQKSPARTTLKAIEEMNEGNAIKCENFDDYLKLVSNLDNV